MQSEKAWSENPNDYVSIIDIFKDSALKEGIGND
jgi:hypothetical protein